VERLMERTMRKSTMTCRGGFTLIEVLVSFTIFAIGMMALSAMQLHALRGGSSGRFTTQASAIAETRMEQFQRIDWAEIADTNGWAAAVTENHVVDVGGGTTATQTYTVDWRIDDLTNGWTRSIDVRVRWDEPGRPNRSVTFSSIRFNREAT
jgi:prepilin-type N-terminal cleavage/methylation domain-containing protein